MYFSTYYKFLFFALAKYSTKTNILLFLIVAMCKILETLDLNNLNSL
jgi:hypothetical protein